MGFLSRWKERQRERFKEEAAPYRRARNELWARESKRLGEEEFQRRLSAVADYQLGRTGPSGFEEWEQQLNAEIEERAHNNAEGIQ